MNSGELDLKMRRNVNVAPAEAGADRIAALAGSGAKPPAATTPAEVQASETTQVSRIERARGVLILFIRCSMHASGLRLPPEYVPPAQYPVSPPPSRPAV